MNYRQKLISEGYYPVPRDDRLFDVFPELTRDRGVELWEKWNLKEIALVQIKHQVPKAKPTYLTMARQKIETALLAGQVIVSKKSA